MMTATLELSMAELETLATALKAHHSGAPSSLVYAIEAEIEKLELVDMSDWNDCGDACKL